MTEPTTIPLCATIVHTPDDEALGRRELVHERSVTLGRDGDWPLQDLAISRTHMLIGSDADDAWVEDLLSKNGTWVNGLRIQGRVTLELPAVVRGGTTVVVAERAPLTVPGVTISGVALGHHPKHLQVLANLEQVSKRSTPVLLVGETGTDRESVARYIHVVSKRGGPFVSLCGADTGIAEIESAFVEADGGTLFLDDVTDLKADAQERLSALLVGQGDDEQAGVRLVATTARVLKTASEDGSLRRDLYALLASYPVKLPPLRHRLTDIVTLFQHFLKEASPGWEPTLHGELAEALVLHSWPSNERELRQVAVTVAAECSDRTYLDVPDLPDALLTSVDEALAKRGAVQPTKEAIEAAMADADGEVARAAKALSSTRVQLYRWLHVLGLT